MQQIKGYLESELNLKVVWLAALSDQSAGGGTSVSGGQGGGPLRCRVGGRGSGLYHALPIPGHLSLGRAWRGLALLQGSRGLSLLPLKQVCDD